jgi:hypothetical protein
MLARFAAGHDSKAHMDSQQRLAVQKETRRSEWPTGSGAPKVARRQGLKNGSTKEARPRYGPAPEAAPSSSPTVARSKAQSCKEFDLVASILASRAVT